MDATRFDALTRALTARPSRRRVTGALAALTFSGMLVLPPGLTGTEARKRKGKGKKNKGGNASPTCTDGKQNGTETDVDCGGSCPRCANGRSCLSRDDCASAICANGTCQACIGNGICGGDGDGDCYCEQPAAGGLEVCYKGEEETTVGSCLQCAGDTVCTTTPSGSFDCHKLCGAP